MQTLLFLLVGSIHAKTISQRHKFHEEDFHYSTKFGAPANSFVTINFKARLLSYVRPVTGGEE